MGGTYSWYLRKKGPSTEGTNVPGRRAIRYPVHSFIAVASLTLALTACAPSTTTIPQQTDSVPVAAPATAVPPNAETGLPQHTRLGLITDFGTCDDGQRWAVDTIDSWDVSAIVTAGDNTQNEPTCTPFEESVWSFFDPGATGAGNPPFWPTPGNHDYTDPGAGLAAYQQAFPYLSKQADPQQRWYTESLGAVRIFVVDTEVTGEELETQRVWLKGALRASRRADPRVWNVVLLHRPPYSSGVHGAADTWRPSGGWRYADWGADITISGHQHVWEDVVVDDFHYVTAGLGAFGNRRDCPAELQPESRICLAGLGVARIEATENTLEISYYQPGPEEEPVLKDTIRLGRPVG